MDGLFPIEARSPSACLGLAGRGSSSLVVSPSELEVGRKPWNVCEHLGQCFLVEIDQSSIKNLQQAPAGPP